MINQRKGVCVTKFCMEVREKKPTPSPSGEGSRDETLSRNATLPAVGCNPLSDA